MVFIFASMLIGLNAQERVYNIYTSNGKKVSYKKMLKGVQEANVVLFGEHHNNPVCHWLQYEFSKSLVESRDSKIIFGAEFFERDDQLIIDEYISGDIGLKNFKKEVKLWDNFSTDYEPLLKLAKNLKVPFIATNIPRRYASMVARKGIGALRELPGQAKRLMMPLSLRVDTNLRSYKSMLSLNMGHGMGMDPLNMVYAQAVKDATMAESIVRSSRQGYTFIHFNGSYHSDYHEGIAYYLGVYSVRNSIDLITISTVEQDDIEKLKEENIGRADFIICIDEDFNKSY